MSSRGLGLFLGAFVDELALLGVEDAVISPGSRSTPLAMVFDASRSRTIVDLDERGAAFFALGLAKVKQRPVCLVCTSGTAAANYYPAICEASAARVPLIVLTADRPHSLRALGAAQTTDQLKMFGDMPVFYHEMPLCDDSARQIDFMRQMARESVVRATGTPAGVVHLNFPFDEPLMPDLTTSGLFEAGRAAVEPAVVRADCALSPELVEDLNGRLDGARGVIVCGEGEYPDELFALAEQLGFPVLADPLSNLRRCDVPVVIDNYDNIVRRQDRPEIDVVIRFGQYPVSKALFTMLAAIDAPAIVIDEVQTRDFNYTTSMLVRADASGFIRAASRRLSASAPAGYLAEWQRMNAEEAEKIAGARTDTTGAEGTYVMRLLDEIPDGSLLFAGNSMAIRYVDTFYLKSDKDVRVYCNRGLNGIDGTVSSALGAAQCFETSTLLLGDVAFLHDINALHLARELETNLTIVVMNNNGGGIFEMLPQKSDEPYFERLFLTPHDVDFEPVVRGFHVPYTRVSDVEGFAAAYDASVSTPGIKVIEVASSTADLKAQFTKYV